MNMPKFQNKILLILDGLKQSLVSWKWNKTCLPLLLELEKKTTFAEQIETKNWNKNHLHSHFIEFYSIEAFLKKLKILFRYN